jgi:glycosyltransferase involved in cell wall biosynthesis
VDWRSEKCFGHLLPNDNLHRIHIPNRWPFFRTLFWHSNLLSSLEKLASNFDLVFNPSQFIHLNGHLSVPYIYVVHDLSFFSFPECHKRGKKSLFRALFGHTLRKADSVVCVSEYTKLELLKKYPQLKEKAKVVYEAAEDHFGPIENMAKLNAIKKKYSLPDKFLLFVGTVEPRKNLDMVFLAYSKLKDQIPYPFYIAGKLGWRADALLSLYEKLGMKDHVRFLGYVPDAELPPLYNLATAFVYVSKDEGFGLPPLEAMQCGTPVMISNTGSLPEIAGDAALVTSAYEPEIMGKHLATLCKDEALRQHFREKGLERARSFSWKKTGDSLHVLFEELTGQRYAGNTSFTSD